MALSQIIARLGVQLGLDTASFTTGSRKAQAEAKTLRSTMTKAAGAIGAAFVGAFTVETFNQMRAMTKEAVNSVGALGEQAQQLGVTTDALQEFRYVASQTGIEQAEIDKALQRLTRTIGDLAAPTKAQAAALKQMGLEAKDFAGKGAGEALLLLADGMAKLPDAATRSSVGFDLMGRSFQTLLPLLNEGSAGIRQMITDAREAGIVLTEKQIADADKAADALTAIELKTQARLSAIYATNGEALVKFETQWAELKIGLAESLISINEGYASLQKASYDLGQSIRSGVMDFGAWMGTASKQVGTAVSSIINSITGMVSGISTQVANRLNAVWAGVKAKIDAVKGWFFDLYDAVIGHSYIPDMVDGIRSEMARLDAVMVAPVTAATSKAQQAFRDMADNTRRLLDQLFPEIRAAMDFRADSALLPNIPEGLRDEAYRRLLMRARGVTSAEDFERVDIKQPDFDPMASFDDFVRQMERVADKALDTKTRVTKSFREMAEDTLNSFNRLTSAIKGGGFLGILEGVIGLGMQLGSIGAFGNKIQTRLTKTVPGYASGTGSAARGFALVGERGPELVRFRGGERVFNNRTSAGMMGGGLLDIRPSPLFEVYLDGKLIQAAPAIASAGARGGVALLAQSSRRRLA